MPTNEEEKQNDVPNDVTKDAETPSNPVNMRKIVIETDGNKVVLRVNETAGTLELISILQFLLQTLMQPR